MTLPPPLFHYCCSHSAEGIERDGALRPWGPLMDDVVPVVWLTDLDVPIRAALGLTSLFSPCDRTEHRYEVDMAAVRDGQIVPWWRYRRFVPADYRQALEEADGA